MCSFLSISSTEHGLMKEQFSGIGLWLERFKKYINPILSRHQRQHAWISRRNLPPAFYHILTLRLFCFHYSEFTHICHLKMLPYQRQGFPQKVQMGCSTDKILVRAVRTPGCGSECVPGWTNRAGNRTNCPISHGARYHGTKCWTHRCGNGCHWTRNRYEGTTSGGYLCAKWTVCHAVLAILVYPGLQHGGRTRLGREERWTMVMSRSEIEKYTLNNLLDN